MSAEINTEQLFALVKELKGKEESKAKLYVGPLVALLIAASGVFVSWGMMMKTTEYLQGQIERLENTTANNQLEIIGLKMAQVRDETTLNQIKDDVKEVRENVNKLIKRKGL